MSPAVVDSDRWAAIVKGVDDTWLYESEGRGWWGSGGGVAGRWGGGRAAPKNSLFQSLSVDMTPLPAVVKLLQHTPSFLFSPPHALILPDLVWKVQAGLDKFVLLFKLCLSALPQDTLALTVFGFIVCFRPFELLHCWITRSSLTRHAMHSPTQTEDSAHTPTPTFTHPHI